MISCENIDNYHDEGWFVWLGNYWKQWRRLIGTILEALLIRRETCISNKHENVFRKSADHEDKMWMRWKSAFVAIQEMKTDLENIEVEGSCGCGDSTRDGKVYFEVL